HESHDDEDITDMYDRVPTTYGYNSQDEAYNFRYTPRHVEGSFHTRCLFDTHFEEEFDLVIDVMEEMVSS
ncbi:hypothetical protein U2066_15300, partial [Listeria monocytogenes]|uniref:hypothetical protein n=1 Tax=Listeria monocytogenes TaxID=1639 RepID=UPI002FDB9CAF